MVGVREVLGDAERPPQTTLALDRLNGGERGTGDALGNFHHPLQCLPVGDRAVAIPNCDAVGKDALDGAAVEVHQDLRRQMDLLQSPQEEETLVSLLDQS